MLEVESKKEFTTHISVNPKIYKPKAKKLCNSYNPSAYFKKKNIHKNKALTPVLNFNFNFEFDDEYISNIKNKNEIFKPQIEKISLEEMAEDFSRLKERKEAKKAEKELLNLLRNSTKDNSQEDNIDEIKRVKRPKRPILENIE